MADKDISIKIDVDSKTAEANFSKTADAAKKLASDLEKVGNKGNVSINKIEKASKTAMGSVNGMLDAFKGFQSLIAGGAVAGLASSIVGVGTACISAASQMRQYEIAFQTMLKSAEAGTAMLQNLQKFAADTPFDVPGVVESAQQLMAFGFSAQEIIPTLRTLGDAAAGLGKGTAGVQQLAYAMGQIKTSGTLKTEDINQLTNAGISAWQMLADAAGKSVTEIKEMTANGTIDSLKAVEILTNGMNSRFGGMMEKTSKEVAGLVSNIDESLGTVKSSVGALLTKSLDVKGALETVSDKVTDLSNALLKATNDGKGFGDVIKDIVPAPVIVTLGALAGVLSGVVVAGFTAATGAAYGFIAATLPISGTVMAVAAAVGAAVALIATYWDEVRAVTQVVWNSIAGIIKGAVYGFMGVVFKAFEQITFGLSKLSGFLKLDTSELDKLHDRLDSAQLEAFEQAKEGFNNLTLSANTYAEALKSIKSETGNIVPASESVGIVAKNEDAKQVIDLAPTGSSSKKSSGVGSASIKQEAIDIKDAIEKARESTKAFDEAFTDLQAKVAYEGMSDYEKAKADINKQKEERLNAIASILENEEKAASKALEIRNNAALQGNAEELKAAEKYYDEKNKLYKAHLEQQEALEAQIEAQAQVALDGVDSNMNNQLTAVEEQWANFSKSISSSFGNAVDSILSGSMTAGQALGKMVADILRNALKMAAEFAALCATLSAFGVIPPGPVAAKMMFGYDSGHAYAQGSTGAKLMGKASGGYISGRGTGTSDSIPAMLSNGEYVIKASAVRKVGLPTLNAINNGIGFADGGIVNASNFAKTSSTSTATAKKSTVMFNINTLDASSFSDFLTRGGGLDRLKQALADDNNEFGSTTGVW